MLIAFFHFLPFQVKRQQKKPAEYFISIQNSKRKIILPTLRHLQYKKKCLSDFAVPFQST